MQTIPFEDLPSTNTLIDAENLNLMQQNIEQAVNDKIGLIDLLEASNTAPEQCETGDLYYNTDTALIYEANGTNTWNTVGNAPSYDYLYLDKKNKVIYYFNGTDLDVFGAAVIDDLTSSSAVNPPSIDAVNGSISAINNKIGSLKPKVLWENPNKNDPFSVQSVTLSTDNYDYLEIYYWDWSESATKGLWDLQCQRVPKGYNTTLITALISGGAYGGVRRVQYRSDTEYLFGTCYGILENSTIINPPAARNFWCVPVLILGYKY